MKLYLLRPIKGLESNPWEPWYDKCFGFVVCAENEEQARKIADENAGDENDLYTRKTIHPWLDSKFSTCVELIPGDKAEVIIEDVHSA